MKIRSLFSAGNNDNIGTFGDRLGLILCQLTCSKRRYFSIYFSLLLSVEAKGVEMTVIQENIKRLPIDLEYNNSLFRSDQTCGVPASLSMHVCSVSVSVCLSLRTLSYFTFFFPI